MATQIEGRNKGSGKRHSPLNVDIPKLTGDEPLRDLARANRRTNQIHLRITRPLADRDRRDHRLDLPLAKQSRQPRDVTRRVVHSHVFRAVLVDKDLGFLERDEERKRQLRIGNRICWARCGSLDWGGGWIMEDGVCGMLGFPLSLYKKSIDKVLKRGEEYIS